MGLGVVLMDGVQCRCPCTCGHSHGKTEGTCVWCVSVRNHPEPTQGKPTVQELSDRIDALERQLVDLTALGACVGEVDDRPDDL